MLFFAKLIILKMNITKFEDVKKASETLNVNVEFIAPLFSIKTPDEESFEEIISGEYTVDDLLKVCNNL